MKNLGLVTLYEFGASVNENTVALDSESRVRTVYLFKILRIPR